MLGIRKIREEAGRGSLGRRERIVKFGDQLQSHVAGELADIVTIHERSASLCTIRHA